MGVLNSAPLGPHVQLKQVVDKNKKKESED